MMRRRRRLSLGARLSARHQGGPPFRTWVNHAVAWVLLLGSLVLAVAVFAMDARDTALRDRGLTARATLLEVHTGVRGNHQYVIAEYPTAGGRLVTAEVDTFEMHPAPHPGDRATVLYDPAPGQQRRGRATRTRHDDDLVPHRGLDHQRCTGGAYPPAGRQLGRPRRVIGAMKVGLPLATPIT